jgi:two-component system LytT family response regulator/two-component system response regulator LytT
MRVIVVDDEKPAREELSWLLEQCEGVEVVAQLASAQQAIEKVERVGPTNVDMVFLDVDMPGKDGVRLAQWWSDRLGDERPLIAFVTAYEEHAVAAFSLDAVDYLLKPVRLARLEGTLDRARRRLSEKGEAVSVAQPGMVGLGDASSNPLERISVEELGEYRVIAVDEILWIEADEGFATVHTAEGDHLTDFSLKFLEENLSPELFFRCHRSYIVRLDAIKRIAPWGAGTYRLLVGKKGEQGVPLARSRAPELKARIPWAASVL